MPRGLWRAAMRLALPQNLPGLPFDAIDHPAVFVFRDAAFAAEIEPFLRRLDLGGTDNRGDEDFVAPDDGRRPAQSGNVGLPRDVFGRAPLVGKLWVFDHAGRLRAAELRPLIVV